ncbi:cupin domain containing protein [Grosmannia clavigera kw1407]|uniref:CENP-C homolog n=1 Tax=Grosmannia clavigera (strain kw1407 / UAMH 11150) TaxID=655863 RepID=F0XA22_GROCL|nr:cupin domain containing protein [Grosmannia clavigera kw1407]EFX05500.1 cupin domain containing protein [Grosmannia clavigera kw1407]
MAPPRASGPRRSQLPNEHIYTLGERGRKTGVTLRDTGVRDEHGMEPMESIFSSPAKSSPGDALDASGDEQVEEDGGEEDDDDGGEVDMDLTTVAGPGPAALLNGQNTAARLAMRQARSPAASRSLFGSPAVRAGLNNKGVAAAAGDQKPKHGALRQNQLLRPPSSPDAANAPPSSPVKPVKRRLDFGKPVSANALRKPVLLPAAARRVEEEDDDEESILHGTPDNGADDSMQMIDGPNEFADDEPEEQDEPSVHEDVAEEEEPVLPTKKRGRPPAKKTARRRPGRPSNASNDVPSPPPSPPPHDDEADEEQGSAKRQRKEAKPKGRPRGRPAANRPVVEEAADEGQSGEASQAGKRMTKKKAVPVEAATGPAPKKRGRGRKSSGVGAAMAAAAAVPRGPPLPKSRGLVIRRRENEEDGAMKRTRSGRTSYQPLAFWRNEHAEFETSEVADSTWRDAQKGTGRRIVLPAMREIYRVEEENLPPLGGTGRRGGGGGSSSQRRHRRGGAKRRGDGDDDDDDDGDNNSGGPERQAWEYDPGRVQGKVALWRPEHELEPPGPDEVLEQAESEIALSALAIQTQDVRDGSFRFAKTLSLPFFGTGVVDLAPGAEKRPKNSRKMHMAFFVHYGHVAVTVNETEFRIAKGGMWSVPRGNYYSIVNDTDRPARIFFSQGCEMLTVLEPDAEEE